MNTRPQSVAIGFWAILAGAVLLVLNGLIALTLSFASRPAGDEALVNTYLTVYRSVGVISVLIGVALAFLIGRARTGDPRFRRAVLALGFAALAVFVMLALFAQVVQPVALVALVPILVGAALLSKADSVEWFTQER